MADVDPLLHLKGVGFSYRGIPALQELDLRVARGESVALLGPNGCGKSTLLKILGGLHFAQAGEYRAFGRTVTEKLLLHDPFGLYFRAAVGTVFQNSDAQLFNPTVEEEIAFGPSQLGEEAEVRARVDAVMRGFGLAGLATRSPFALSGGEKKKVALASVLVMEPEVLLLDEPTGGLDPRSARALTDLLIDWRARGKTIVTATHDLHLVPEIASRVIILGDRGKVLADGDPRAVLTDVPLLERANLIHLHRHPHMTAGGILWHAHDHDHGGSSGHDHAHDHDAPQKP